MKMFAKNNGRAGMREMPAEKKEVARAARYSVGMILLLVTGGNLWAGGGWASGESIWALVAGLGVYALGSVGIKRGVDPAYLVLFMWASVGLAAGGLASFVTHLIVR